MKLFLICPVRGALLAETEAIRAWVASRESAGDRVHWPARDTPQLGDGAGICSVNREAMESAEAVAVWWKPGSEGSVFDLGMAFALRKTVLLASPVDATPGKSFSNVLRCLAVPSPRGGEGEPTP